MMTYRMKNWDFLKDMMCSNKDVAKSDIERSLKKISIPLYHKDTSGSAIIDDVIESCKCVNTRDGLEACINSWREDLSPAFRTPGENPDFERFLEALDDEVGKTRKVLAKEHRL